MPAVRPIRILLVEDSPSDAGLAIRALRKGALPHDVHHVSQGEEAIEYLRDLGANGDRLPPDLVLLDLNLPGMSGHEVLAAIKSDPRTQSIPVIVLTTSDRDQDVRQAYRNMANCYIRKPVDLTQFDEAMQSLERFWLGTVTLPT